MEWDADNYLRFGAQRTRVVRDLVARVQQHLAPGQVRRIADLGCGPGNSTAVLAEIWPEAELVGIDQSEAMLHAARASHPELRFLSADITAWSSADSGTYDLVFSNSALQWVGDHAALLPRLMQRIAPGGALAFQIPAGTDAPACALPHRLEASPQWCGLFSGKQVQCWHAESLAFYYDVLAPRAAAVDLWDTEYGLLHRNVESILEWYRGSGLRPYLQALPDEAARERFQQEYLDGLRAAYPARPSGAVLFPFLRRFVIARAGK